MVGRWIVALAPMAAALNWIHKHNNDPTAVSNVMTGKRIKDYSPGHDRVRVACVGDSITWGMVAVPHSQASYPQLLQEQLGDDFEVINFGHNTRAMMKDADLPYWQVDEHQWAITSDADVVVIMLGTNDARNANANKTIDNYVPDYLQFIEDFRKMTSKPEVFVVAPPPVVKGEISQGWNTTVQNELLPDMVKEVSKQAKVNFIDVHTVFQRHCPGGFDSPCNWISDDGVHPFEAGYAAIAFTVHAAIQKTCAQRLQVLQQKPSLLK